MRSFISIFMIFALVITTAMAPSMSHATPHNSVKAAQTQVSKSDDCHHGAKQSESGKTTHNINGNSSKCCDKGMCKCIGGACSNGLSKMLGNGIPVFNLASSEAHFGLTDRNGESALSERLKRPPRA